MTTKSSQGENQFLILDNALIQTTSDYQIYALVVIILIVLVGAITFFFLIRRQLRPLHQLIFRVSQVDISHLDSLTEGFVMEGSSEIEDLSKAFDQAFTKIYEGYLRQKEFSINVSHEIRTPLAVLQSQVHLLKEMEKSEIGKKSQMIATLEQQIKRLSQLVEGLLLLSDSKERNLSLVQPAYIIEEIFFDLEDQAKEKEVSLHLSGQIDAFYTDDILLERLLFNLIENALKYNVPQGKVVVNLEQSDNQVKIQVCDTGIGIRAEDREKVFDLFYRGDDSRSRDTGGYGVGLSLVRHIVGSLGGKIELQEDQPSGLRVDVILPLMTKRS